MAGRVDKWGVVGGRKEVVRMEGGWWKAKKNER